MKYFYKIKSGKAILGIGEKIPDGFTEYEKGGEPDELKNILETDNIQKLKKNIEKKADDFVQKQLKELDYNDMGEVALYASNPNSEWHDEAVALQKWVEEVYQKMYELIDSVTVDNYTDIDLDKIEAEYPAFEFNE